MLFKYNNCIYYFEIKSNCNLDTEKSKAVFEKLTTMENLLKSSYPDTDIVVKVAGLRYPDTSCYTFVKKPLNSEHIFGYKDIFNIIGEDINENEWKYLFKCIENTLHYFEQNNITCIEKVKTKNNNNMNPIFKWSGGKRDEIQTFEPYFPDMTTVDTYVEPFIGAGAVYFYLNHKNNVINDNHPELYNFYNQCSNNYEKIMEYLNSFENTEQKYYEIRSQHDVKDPIYQASRFFYLRQTCYRGMIRYNSKGEFNIPFGFYKKTSYNLTNDHVNLLKNTTILNLDFLQVCEKYDDKNNFVFLDPPYDSTFKNYNSDFTKRDHIRLFKWFSKAKSKCMLIIGETPFIYSLYKDFIKCKYRKKYAFKLHGNRIKSSDIDNNHFIITNY